MVITQFKIGSRVADRVYLGNVLITGHTGEEIVDNLRVLESGDIRITENGQSRAIESAVLPDQTSEYIDRVNSSGGVVTPIGQSVIAEVFAAADAAGVAIASGWLFGSEVNVSRSNHLNLAAGRSSLTPSGSLNSKTNLSPGMLGLRVEAANQGLTSTEPLFTSDTNYNILLISQYAGDPVGDYRQETPYIFDQEVGGGGGNLAFLGGVVGGTQWIDRPSTNSGMRIDKCEANVGPVMTWFSFDENANYRIINAGEELKSASFALNGLPTQNFRLGKFYQNADLGYCAVIRFDGALDDIQRRELFDRVWGACRKLTKAIMVIGNSVTISGVSDPSNTWPKQMQRWGCYNGSVLARRAQGAMRLPKFAPLGYSLPAEAHADPSLSLSPVNDYDWFAANVVINDEQQNMIGNGQPWSAFVDCHNAIVSYFAQFNDDMLAVMCTQMAHVAVVFGQDLPGTPVSYTTAASRGAKFLSASQSARSETNYNGVPTALAEVYAAFNLGWATEYDGNPSDPLNDSPNGNPLLMHDAQHPNQTGHDLMFTIYRNALLALLE